MYGSSGWTVSRTGEGESPAILLTNVDDVAKVVHKRLQREQINHGPGLYYDEEISPFFGAVITGCKDTLKRHRMVWCPNATASQPVRAHQDVITRGLNLGEAAAGALAKWAEREQEADILMFRWEHR